MQRAPTSPERISVALGLCIVMLATLPRYMAGGHETRQTLIIFALALVAFVTVIQWRLLAAEARRRLPRLCMRLVVMLLLGMAIMGGWHALFTDWISWQVFISHGATLGVLLHAISLWWSGERQSS
ncbi:hypothetical protein KF947_00170 [Halomonas sp. FeN2]|uniref:Transmembrane protein n=1 Tax=Vreelandella neptunia TaxID=115551 RepID=A0ABZ0YT59_9GAMM|nr:MULTISPECIES: hypothetical protein [Halomonas]MBF56986.1 hypothetical protein [Halomonas sp.]MDN3562255.1 hypothetical protein [Halomonas neptunia]UBR49970.1 hypothetical protein KF947_00170 [Halomonas sp. FeN2]WQH14784.1 hypothetical protein SR894_09670 [Halomonas neptunia]|tara:strand:- start:123 stop:500 length:378 start_codon:yes stop_codon:yes gene_type:complete